MCDLHRLKSQATVTFFPVQGLENNVAYWTSFGVAEAEPSIFLYFFLFYLFLCCYEVALVPGFPWFSGM